MKSRLFLPTNFKARSERKLYYAPDQLVKNAQSAAFPRASAQQLFSTVSLPPLRYTAFSNRFFGRFTPLNPAASCFLTPWYLLQQRGDASLRAPPG